MKALLLPFILFSSFSVHAQLYSTDYLILDSPFSAVANYNKLIQQNISGYKLVDTESGPGTNMFFYKNTSGEELYILYNVPVMFGADHNISHYGVGKIFFRGNLSVIFNLLSHLGNSGITLDQIKLYEHLNKSKGSLYSHGWQINYKGDTTRYYAYFGHSEADKVDYWTLEFAKRYVGKY